MNKQLEYAFRVFLCVGVLAQQMHSLSVHLLLFVIRVRYCFLEIYLERNQTLDKDPSVAVFKVKSS